MDENRLIFTPICISNLHITCVNWCIQTWAWANLKRGNGPLFLHPLHLWTSLEPYALINCVINVNTNLPQSKKEDLYFKSLGADWIGLVGWANDCYCCKCDSKLTNLDIIVNLSMMESDLPHCQQSVGLKSAQTRSFRQDLGLKIGPD